ncbi:tetratricopeptide repeat domain-containing protein [Fusarium heterosporum]|uniref:Tetratricopeptide repeat domain-containing protein n=1 Tax=Fusarium heterosporum TaxID=42747 RepID=A0A8H5TFF2_FUSHE|nr:tetratricopeptide repeat domain-containing protein [Fusarium heterosporum]
MAYDVATRFVSLRRTEHHMDRRDWFYLSIARIDALIGLGRYEEASLALRDVMNKPTIPPTLHVMTLLRLSKIQRRIGLTKGTDEASGIAWQSEAVIKLFNQVPKALQDEVIEETACRISTNTEHYQMQQENLSIIDILNTLTGETSVNRTPAMERYMSVQSRISHQASRKDHTSVSSSPARSQAADEKEGRQHRVYELASPSCTTFLFSQTRNPGFLPRDEVATITSLLLQSPPYQRLCLMYGEAGIGKTSIATEIVYSCYRSFDAIIWIDASSVSQIDLCVKFVALKLGLDAGSSGSERPHIANYRQSFVEWLRLSHTSKRDSQDRTILLVFDGIDSEESLKPFWSLVHGPCSVLLTSRNDISIPKHGGSSGSPHRFKIDPLSQNQAVQLLEESDSRYTKEAWYDVAESLRNHPAALKRIATSMDPQSIVAFELNQRISKPSLYTSEIVSQRNHSLPLITIWFASFSSVRAEALLDVMSFLNEAAVPQNLLLPDAPCSTWNIYPSTRDEFGWARKELIDYSLIWTRDDNVALATSPTIATLRRGLMSHDRFTSVYGIVLTLLSSAWPCNFLNSTHVDDSDQAHTGPCLMLWPQLRNLKSRVEEFGMLQLPPNIDIQGIQVLLNISWCAIGRLLLEEADDYCTLASTIIASLNPDSLSESQGTAQYEYSRKALHFRAVVQHHRGWLNLKHKNRAAAKMCFEHCINQLNDAITLDDEMSWGLYDRDGVFWVMASCCYAYESSDKLAVTYTYRALQTFEKNGNPCFRQAREFIGDREGYIMMSSGSLAVVRLDTAPGSETIEFLGDWRDCLLDGVYFLARGQSST